MKKFVLIITLVVGAIMSRSLVAEHHIHSVHPNANNSVSMTCGESTHPEFSEDRETLMTDMMSSLTTAFTAL